MRSRKGWILAAPLPVTQMHCIHLSSPGLALPSQQVLNHWFKLWLSISTTPFTASSNACFFLKCQNEQMSSTTCIPFVYSSEFLKTDKWKKWSCCFISCFFLHSYKKEKKRKKKRKKKKRKNFLSRSLWHKHRVCVNGVRDFPFSYLERSSNDQSKHCFCQKRVRKNSKNIFQ